MIKEPLRISETPKNCLRSQKSGNKDSQIFALAESELNYSKNLTEKEGAWET